MIKRFIRILICIGIAWTSKAQQTAEKANKSMIKSAEEKAKEAARKAPISWYKIYTIEKDTTPVDTTLSLKRFYQFNYLRKDRFGQLM